MALFDRKNITGANRRYLFSSVSCIRSLKLLLRINEYEDVFCISPFAYTKNLLSEQYIFYSGGNEETGV